MELSNTDSDVQPRVALSDEVLSQKKKVEEDNQELKAKLDNLKVQLKTLQSEFDEEVLKLSAEKTKVEMDRDELKDRSVGCDSYLSCV